MRGQHRTTTPRPAAVALALVLCASPLGAQDAPATRVDWPAFLSQQDLTWNGWPDSWWSGAFTGNGGLGAMVWYDRALRFDLGHTELWDHQPDGGLGEGRAGRTRLNPGSLSLHLVGTPLRSTLRLDLWNAEVTGEITTTAGVVRVRSFTHAERDVMVVELTPSGAEVGASWRFTPFPARAHWGRAPRDNPPPEPTQRGGGFACDQSLVAGGGYTTAWRETTLGDGRRVLVLSIAYDPGGGAHRSRATGLVDAAHAEGVEALERTHRAWWHDYWPRSWVHVPDAALERFYWVQMYKLASATRADRPVYDLLGPWGRDTRWAGLWWNLNVQMAYWPVYTSGRLELGLSLVRALARAERDGVLAANEPVEAFHGRSGALATSTDRSLRATVPLREHCDLTWALHNVWLQYRHSMDESLLRETLVPMLRRAANYYLLRLTRSPVADRWNIPPSRSPEYDVEGPNPSVDVALLRWALDTLIDADERLALRDPDRQRWESVRRELVDLPADDTGILIATGVAQDHPHREPAHLMAIHPLHQLRREVPSELALMERSVHRWTRDPRVGLAAMHEDRSGYSYTWGSQLAAAMGRGDDALALLRGTFEFVDDRAGTGITPNTFYRDGGWPTSETPMGAASALQDLLLQSHGGTVAVFPATPSQWGEVEFQGLRAEGAFVVSAVRRGGVTRAVVIESLAGEACRVRCDLPRPWRLEAGRALTATASPDGTVTLDLRRGERVRITSDVPVAVDAGVVDGGVVAAGGCRAGPTAGRGAGWGALLLLLGLARRGRRSVQRRVEGV